MLTLCLEINVLKCCCTAKFAGGQRQLLQKWFARGSKQLRHKAMHEKQASLHSERSKIQICV